MGLRRAVAALAAATALAAAAPRPPPPPRVSVPSPSHNVPDVPEPYPWLHGGAFTGPGNPASFDPMLTYV